MATSMEGDKQPSSNPPIRPRPRITLKAGKGFAMCRGKPLCRGEKCGYAHTQEELEAWNRQLQNHEGTLTVDDLTRKIPSMSITTDPPIRPRPDITLKGGKGFAMCRGKHLCRGEKCGYAHTQEELKAWTSQLQNPKEITMTVDELKQMIGTTEELKTPDYSIIDYKEFQEINENQDTPDDKHVKPSCVEDKINIRMVLDKETEVTHGKWLVFRDLDKIDETWSIVVQAMKRDQLGGCTEAKCTTLMYNIHSYGPGPCTTGQISVYTGEMNVDAVGSKLIALVQQDLRYKTEKVTRNNKYVHKGDEKISSKKIFYNGGRPSNELKGGLCKGFDPHREDKWHMNEVKCPGVPEVYFGYWVLEFTELTALWHSLKQRIESERESFGALKMICPSKANKTSTAIIKVFTNKKGMKSTGLQLINMVKRNIKFEELKSGNTAIVKWD